VNVDPDMSADRKAPTPASGGLSRAALAKLVNCGFCWAIPGTPCTDAGQHYARYLRAYRRGFLDAAGLVTVSAAIRYITPGTVVPDTSPVTSSPR
jgi:hypothetical protein